MYARIFSGNGMVCRGELFCGDLIENLKTPKLGSIMDDVPAAVESIRKLAGMSITTVYPGHGRPFVMQTFLQTWQQV